ncbi:hypothetical protein LTR74_009708 [Friedmanniomyces endolithicus]|nr:hypothetical protein LTR74_009708 [Friedmanniomyces endolithicus]
MRTLCIFHDAGAGGRAGDRVPRVQTLQQAEDDHAMSGSQAVHLPALPLTRIQVSSAASTARKGYSTAYTIRSDASHAGNKRREIAWEDTIDRRHLRKHASTYADHLAASAMTMVPSKSYSHGTLLYSEHHSALHLATSGGPVKLRAISLCIKRPKSLIM